MIILSRGLINRTKLAAMRKATLESRYTILSIKFGI